LGLGRRGIWINKEWFQASSDYQKANDANIGSEERKEYKLAGDAHSKLAGEEAISTVLAQTGFKPASWGVDLAGMIERVTDNPAEHEEKAQKLTFDDIRKEAVKHITPNIGLDHRNTPWDGLNSGCAHETENKAR
jgi:hypothetical protein